MKIHPYEHDLGNAGLWDLNTSRYVPVSGGSRSRLPVRDDEDLRRYYGYVGIDEHLTPDIHLIAQWYNYIGGRAVMPEGDAGKFTQLLVEQNNKRMQSLIDGVPEED